MSISKSEAKQLLERLIFEDSSAQEWTQDVWSLNPLLGENAAKLWDVFEQLIEFCPEEPLEHLLHQIYQDQMEHR